MIYEQLVLPGIPPAEPQMISDPEFTFGIEIEGIHFWNGKPLRTVAYNLVRNKETGIVYEAIFTIERIHEEGKIVDRDLEVILTEVSDYNTEQNLGIKYRSKEFYDLPTPVQEAWKLGDNRKKMPRIDLDSNGNLPKKWVEDDKKRCWAGPDPDDTFCQLNQARKLLDSHGLNDWKVEEEETVTDSAIDGIELISPVLNEGDYDSIRKVCNLFKDLMTTDNTCGLHVHVAIKDHRLNLDQLRRLVFEWVRIESTLMTLPDYKTKPRSNMPISPLVTIYRDWIDEADNIIDFIDKVNQTGRNATLNLYAYRWHKTIEFRELKSTLDPDRIAKLVEFCIGFMKETLCSN